MSDMKSVNEKVYKIIGACIEVHKTLGPGYPIEFYQKALDIELKEKELDFESHCNKDVFYKESLVGNVAYDFIVEKKALLLLRCQDNLHDHEVQHVLRGLSLTDCEIGILVNFGQVKIQYKRVVHGRSQLNQHRKSPIYRSGHSPMSTGRTRENNPIQ